MLDFSRYFENPFDDVRIIDARLLNFIDDHIERLKARNADGEFDALIAELTARRDALRADQVTEDVARSRRIGKTSSVDALVVLFKEDVRRHEGTLRGLFEEDSETYLSFFPQGLSEYTAISRPEAPVLFARWRDLTAGLAGLLPPALVTLFKEYATQYATVRQAQQQEQGQVTAADTAALDARTRAELALVKGMHKIGERFPGQAEECAAFFNQSLLLPQTKKGGLPETDQPAG